MNPENIETIKNLIKEALEKMGFCDFSVSVREENGPSGEDIVFNIGTKESDLLIGQHGVNLRSLQFVLRSMARRKVEERLRFSIDINDYNRQKANSIAELARSMARRAIADGRSVILRPMSAYERRLVHMELAAEEGVKTESVGEGEERKVVIKPVGNIESE